MDKSKLKNFIDDNNSLKSNIKDFVRLVNSLNLKTEENESIKEDDLSKIIYLKVLLKKQLRTDELRAKFEIPEATWAQL